MLILTPQLLILVIATLINLLLLGAIFAQNPRSATHRLFALLSLAVTFWLIAAHLSTVPETNLLWARLTIFFATLMTMFLYLFSHTLPKDTFSLSRAKTLAVFLSTLAVMAVTVSPYAFTGIDRTGGVPHLTTGFGMAVFGFLSTLFSFASIYVLWEKFRKGAGVEREQTRFVFLGATIMLGLLVLTVLIPVVVWQSDFFARFIPLYSLIFLGMTAYAIVKYRLFHLKVIATQALTVVLWVVLFSKLFGSVSMGERVTDGLIFAISVVFGILLVRSVQKEVKQREELQRLTEQLAAANAQLFELNRFKTQLLSLASHQIKSPLAAIKGFISLLLEGLYGPVSDKVQETLGKIKNSADVLVELINTILDLRKVEEGKMDYRFSRTGFAALVRRVMEGLEPLAKQKNLRFELQVPAEEVFVSADAPKLSQVVQNLVDNAIKYTPAGFVRVRVEGVKDHARLEVADSGLGVEPAFIPRIFEEFVRDERVKKEIKGTGLGLYIAKKIVEAHHGTIGASSEGEGKGSVFFVELKREPVTPPQSAK